MTWIIRTEFTVKQSIVVFAVQTQIEPDPLIFETDQ